MSEEILSLPIWQEYWLLVERYKKMINLTAWDDFAIWMEVGIKPSLKYSAALNDHDLNDKTLLDVGSGQGLPGVVIAIMHPGLQVVLLEPRTKRAAFLQKLSFSLKLKTKVINKSTFDLTGTFDFITARAVSNSAAILKWTAHLADEKTKWILRKDQEEKPARVIFIDY